MPTTATAKNYDVSQIHQGPADLWIIGSPPADSATPQLTLDLPSGTPDATAHPSSICFGTTKAGSTFSIKNKISDIKADQFEAPIDKYLEEMDAMIEGELSMQGVTLLQQAISTGVFSTVASPGYNQLTFGGNSTVPFVAIAAISKKRTGTNLYIVSLLFKCASQGGVTVIGTRSKDSTHKIQMHGLVDITRTAGRQIGVHYETT